MGVTGRRGRGNGVTTVVAVAVGATADVDVEVEVEVEAVAAGRRTLERVTRAGEVEREVRRGVSVDTAALASSSVLMPLLLCRVVRVGDDDASLIVSTGAADVATGSALMML